MKNIIKGMRKSEIAQRNSLFIAFILNAFVITVLFLFSTCVANIFNEKLNPTDADQIVLVLSSIVSLAIVAVFFYQWIVSILVGSLFEERKTQNINFKMLGASNNLLIKIYVRELIRLQMISLPLGVLGGYWLFLFIARKHDFVIKAVDIRICLLVAGVYLFTLFLSCRSVFKRLIKFDIIHEMRKENKISNYKLKKSHIITFFLGCILLILTYLLKFNTDSMIEGLMGMVGFLLIITSILLMFNFGYFLLHRNFLKLFQNLKIPFINVSELYMLGHYKKMKSSIIMILISISIIVGLQSLFQSSRNDAYKSVVDNVIFSDLFVYDQYIDDTGKSDFQYNFIISKVDNYQFRRLYGIDSNYLKYENLVLDHNLNNESDFSDLDNSEWNGIFLPQLFLKKDDIGKDFIINIDHVEYVFKIAGGYYMNNLGEVDYLVSKGYLQNLLDEKDKINAACLLNNTTDTISPYNSGKSDYIHITKADIAKISYEKVVSSSILLEIVAGILFVGAIIMLISFYIITARQNQYDIVKFRGMGMPVKKIIFIFIIQITTVILHGFLIGYPLALKFSQVFRKMILPQWYMKTPVALKLDIILIMFLIIWMISLLTFFMSVKDSLKRNIVHYLREF